MISLRDLQNGFLQAVLSGEDMPIASLVKDGSMGADARLAIYRSNVFHNLREALRDVYPVIERLVGEEFFAHAAEHYIPRYPSASGDIHRYGQHFPEFLETFCPTLPYLGDTARLEWAWHEAFHAAEHAPLALSRLAEVPPALYSSLRFYLHPASRLLSSPYPVHRIWKMNQPESTNEETLDLEEGGVCLLVRREVGCYAIAIEPVNVGDYALLVDLARGNTLAQAVASACEVCEGFELASRLRHYVESETLVDFSLADEPAAS